MGVGENIPEKGSSMGEDKEELGPFGEKESSSSCPEEMR